MRRLLMTRAHYAIRVETSSMRLRSSALLAVTVSAVHSSRQCNRLSWGKWAGYGEYWWTPPLSLSVPRYPQHERCSRVSRTNWIESVAALSELSCLVLQHNGRGVRRWRCSLAALYYCARRTSRGHAANAANAPLCRRHLNTDSWTRVRILLYAASRCSHRLARPNDAPKWPTRIHCCRFTAARLLTPDARSNVPVLLLFFALRSLCEIVSSFDVLKASFVLWTRLDFKWRN